MTLLGWAFILVAVIMIGPVVLAGTAIVIGVLLDTYEWAKEAYREYKEAYGYVGLSKRDAIHIFIVRMWHQFFPVWLTIWICLAILIGSIGWNQVSYGKFLW